MNIDTAILSRMVGPSSSLAWELRAKILAGDYARVKSDLGRLGRDYGDSCVDAYIRCLGLHCTGQPQLAIAAAEKFVALSRGTDLEGRARRVLAQRLWDFDLRANFERVLDLLSGCAGWCDEVESVLASVLVADFQQCRGYESEASSVLFAMEERINSMSRSAYASVFPAFALARARSLQGFREHLAARLLLERASGVAAMNGDWSTLVEIGLRHSRTALLAGDVAEAHEVLSAVKQQLAVARRRGVTFWDALELEATFLQTELELVSRDGKSAMVSGQLALAEARAQDSREVEMEVLVLLANASVLAGDLRQAITAICELEQMMRDGSASSDAYLDLRDDIKRVRDSHRFQRLARRGDAGGRNGST